MSRRDRAGPAAALVALLLTLGTAPAMAQDSDDNDVLASVGYDFRRQFRERTRIFGDLVYEERADLSGTVGDNASMWTTGGLSYDVSERFRVEGGIGLYYEDYEVVHDVLETRLWQAATFDWPDGPGWVRRVVLSHRLRVEERWRRAEETNFSLRLRYRMATAVALNRYAVEPGAIYTLLRAEWYVTPGDEEEFFAQRFRGTVGFGYVINPTWQVEARYAVQQVRDTVDAGFGKTKQFIELRVKSSLRIRDLVKSR